MYLRNLENHPDLADGHCQAITAFDGVQIRTAHWPSRAPHPKGTVCIVQGRSEFIEKYYEVITELRQRGFAVALYDLRGQGGSGRMLEDPLKGHVDHFEDYVSDLGQFMREIALPECPPPHYALGHSTGCLILLSALPRMRATFERALLCSPLVELAISQRSFLGMRIEQTTARRLMGFLRLVGLGKAYIPGAQKSILNPLGFPTNPLTSDGPRYDRTRQYLIDYPELGIAGPTAQWVHEICKATDQLQSTEFQASIYTPSLIITAGLDTVVNSHAAEYFASTTRAAKAITLPGSRHEIMIENDVIRAQFWAAFDSFIPGKHGLKLASLAE